MRIAWFSPLPPTPSGIAAYSAELLPLLAARHGNEVDVFTAESAADYVWKQRRVPYSVTVYQLGNASWHDYMWAYLFRYPGVVVLHDAQLHQARALALTRRWVPRRQDYVEEFRANHPEAPVDVANLVIAGLGGSLYHLWPMIRLVVERALITVVHNRLLMQDLQQRLPGGRFEHVAMGVSDPRQHIVSDSQLAAIRLRHGVPHDATIVAAYGGVTPEKRIDVLLRAMGSLADRHPKLHLLLVGQSADHFDVMSEAARWRVADRVHLSGYVADEMLPVYLSVADFCACLRWPSNGETSASWLRCLAAGRATIVTDLATIGDVPTLDPRGWQPLDTETYPARSPVAVSIELIDEMHSLELAIDRLAMDAALRQTLGQAAHRWWEEHHQLDSMADAYQRVLHAATRAPQRSQAPLPAHLIDEGWSRAETIAREMGIGAQLDALRHT